VQKVREAANRLKCASNLKQIGLGLLNFESTYGKFPPGLVVGPFPEGGVTTDGAEHSWGPYLLPFIEQQALASQYHWEADYGDWVNQPVVSTQLPLLQCPSAEPNRVVMDELGFTDGRVGACTDYACVYRVDSSLADLGLINPVANYNGILVLNQMVRVAEVLDGVSQTILMTEDAGRPKVWRQGQQVPIPDMAGGPWSSRYNRIVVKGSSADGSVQPGPCAMNCTNEDQVYSFHPGGANAVFADGSVHFLRASMDIRTLAALVTRAGGEVVAASDY
jgi:prepilin-type processing-associated H-X9-DG protein